jgi:phosphatidylserine/phosphatidylglycerophosphate/cardiolipin synthase-like enzyme
MSPPNDWFLRFANPSGAGDPNLAGLPWGAGTEYASRAAANRPVPYDDGNRVEPLIGGYWAMSEIRDALVTCLAAARAQKKPPGQNGLVYLAGWRCNPLRDLSVGNSWGTSPWMSGITPIAKADHRDETVLGLLVALIGAGVMVRVMVWMPTLEEDFGVKGHGPEHVFLATAIRAANDAAKKNTSDPDIGVCCLDMRVTPAAIPVGTHHQKMCVIRYADDTPPVAFVGGVDLAYTRRDAPHNPSDPGVERSPSQWFDGDWQSGESKPAAGTHPPQGIPTPGDGWPLGDPTAALPVGPALRKLPTPSDRMPSDLNERAYGVTGQRWHDQHLKLHGPIVATVQQQFCERWSDAGYVGELPRELQVCQWLASQGEVWFSSAQAFSARDEVSLDNNTIATLPPVAPVAPVSTADGGTSQVQMWRTIPARPRGTAPQGKPQLFAHGEFTVMAGMARAMGRATKIAFICDQYFWSIPAARLLNLQVRSEPDLAVIIILPPHADATDDWKVNQASAQHHARRLALANLSVGMTAEERGRVGVFNAWDPVSGNGVYVHAKSHVYDGELLVCGSANINRRSLTGDSELALAVYDPPVVTAHLRALWKLFSGRAPWPTGPSGAPYDPRTDAGLVLLEALRKVNLPNLIADPQWADPTPKQYTLPNGAPIDTRPRSTPFHTFYYPNIMESCSLELGEIENPSSDLAHVSAAVETPAWFSRVGRSPKTHPRSMPQSTPMVVMP